MKHSKNINDSAKGLSVEVRNGDFNKALRIFKKKVQEAGIIQEVRDREAYVKPSEQRKRAKAAGRKRWLKKLEKMEGAIPTTQLKKNKR